MTRIARRLVPARVRRWLRRLWADGSGAPPVGEVRLGDLRRRGPLSQWGYSRGKPIDRHYIERFLGASAGAIQGTVLEFGDPSYTRRFGGDRVRRSEVLHVVAGTPGATLVGDVTQEGVVPSNTYDCIVCTQTLQQIRDPAAAVGNLRHALRPGGVLLVTVPGISQIDRSAMSRWGDYWRFTTLGLATLMRQSFADEEVEVRAHGNVLTSAAFLYGLAVEDLSPGDLDEDHPDYELVITARATKRSGEGRIDD